MGVHSLAATISCTCVVGESLKLSHWTNTIVIFRLELSLA